MDEGKTAQAGENIGKPFGGIFTILSFFYKYNNQLNTIHL